MTDAYALFAVQHDEEKKCRTRFLLEWFNEHVRGPWRKNEAKEPIKIDYGHLNITVIQRRSNRAHIQMNKTNKPCAADVNVHRWHRQCTWHAGAFDSTYSIFIYKSALLICELNGKSNKSICIALVDWTWSHCEIGICSFQYRCSNADVGVNGPYATKNLYYIYIFEIWMVIFGKTILQLQLIGFH